ncbi:MAG: HAD family hydrolase [Gemmatimonadaceae bacterium]
MLRGVIFDIDGTLIDSNAAHAQSWVETLGEAGYEVPYEIVWPMMGMGADKLLPTATGIDSESKLGKELVKRRWELFREKYLPALRPTPGARALAEKLKSDGLKLLVATSAKGDEVQMLLEAAGVADLMEQRAEAGGGESSKPDPDIVQAAVRKSRMKPEELIMLGDTPYDVQASIGAHVNLVALLSGGWTILELNGATAIYDHPADLLRWYEASPLSVKALAD